MNTLTSKIEALAKKEGAAMVGFAPASRYDLLPRKCGPRPTDIYPQAQSVICIAVQMPDVCMERGCYHDYGDPEGGFINVIVSLRLNVIASKIARMLEQNHYTAFPVAATVVWRYRPYNEFDAPFLSDLSHRHMAVGAGLGEFGWNGLLLTPEYGPRVRLVSVVTNADLTPSPLYEGPALCDRCMRCVKSCSKHIKGLTEGTHGKVQFTIGGKACEYANKNLWYCAWTENFGIQYDAPKPPSMNETNMCEVFRDIVKNHPDWWKTWTVEPCWGECLPPALRQLDPAYSHVPRRRKPLLLNGDQTAVSEMVRTKVSQLSTNRFAETDVSFIDIGSDTELVEAFRYYQPDIKSLIAVCVPLPDHYQDINTFIWQQVISLELDLITWLDQSGYGALQLSFLRDREDCKLLARVFEKYQLIAAQANCSSGSKKLYEGILSASSFLEGESCRIAVIGSNVALTPQRYRADRKLNLPVAVDLKQELVTLAAELGLDLFGVSSRERLDELSAQLRVVYNGAYRFDAVDLNPGKGPYIPQVNRRDLQIPSVGDYLKDARSVLAIGLSLSDGIIDQKQLSQAQAIGPYATHRVFQLDLLTEYAYHICERLRQRGYQACPVLDLFGTESVFPFPIREFRKDTFSSRFAAIAAGLGELGQHGMLLTPQFGVRQICMSIVTDAPLTADPLYHGAPLCRDCDRCVAACPVQAIGNCTGPKSILTLDGKAFTLASFRHNHCDWAKRYSLVGDEGPKYTTSQTNVMPPEEITAENLAEALKQTDEIQKDYFLVMEPCFIACPGGRR